MNSLCPHIENVDNKITSFVIEQTAPDHLPTLRSHFLNIALFDTKDGIPTIRKIVSANVSGAKTEIKSLHGEPTPDFVFINHGDFAYGKIILDEKSLKYVMTNIEKFDNPLLSQQIWSTLRHMLRDAKIPASEFVVFIGSKIDEIRDNALISSVLESARTATFAYLPPAKTIKAASRMFEICLRKLPLSVNNDQRIIWANNLVAFSYGKENTGKLLKMFDEGVGIPDFDFNQGNRWSILSRASAWGFDVEERLKKEKERDPSDRGQLSYETALVSKPDPEVKEKAWNRIRTDKTSSHYTISAVIGGFAWNHQRELLRKYEQKYFEEVVEIYRHESKEYFNAFDRLFPFHAEDPEIFKKTKEILESLTETDRALSYDLKIHLDDYKRTSAAFELEEKRGVPL